MKKRKHIQACELGESIYGKKSKSRRAAGFKSGGSSKKELMKVYNKFYKDQVSALYKAIHNIK